MALTDVTIRSAKGREKPYQLADGSGLVVEVMPSGVKRWLLRYRYHGKACKMLIGRYPDLSLVNARKAAGKAREALALGVNPADAKKQEIEQKQLSSERTFRAAAGLWCERMSGAWSVLHRQKVQAAFESNIYPFIGDRPIADLKPLEVLAVLQKVEKAGKFETALRLRERCSAVFRHAILLEWCEYDPAAALRGVLKTVPAVPRKAMKREELPEFLQRLNDFDGHRQTKLMLELVMLVFTRIGETAAARWAEVDFERGLWTIPPEHRKLKITMRPYADSHVVPLARQTLEVFRQLHEISGGREHVFPNRNDPRRPMSPETARRALERMGYKGKVHVHGFRATASTILNEAGFNRDAVERQLSHLETNKVRAAYNRAEYLDERRSMMQWWADYLDTMKSGKVLPVDFKRAG